jgi:hypothetical protein
MGKSLKEIEKQLEETAQALQAAIRQAAGPVGGNAWRAAESPRRKKHRIEPRHRNHVPHVLPGADGSDRLADNKANMMISINGIIISIIIAALAPKLDSNPWMLVPTTIFLLGTLVSMVYAVLAARPRVSSKPLTLTGLEHSQGNILFFGDFANLSEAHFLAGMSGLMGDRELLYETMIRNIYGLGAVLKTKFVLLQIAYTAFMLALVLGVLSFIGVFVWVLQRAG